MSPRTLLLSAAIAALIVPARRAVGQSDSSPDRSRASRRDATPAPDDAARSALGMTVSVSGSDRDTLGVLVSDVVPNGPADAAGVDQGSRIAEIDGLSLRLEPEDVGLRPEEESVLRRMDHELRTLRPGDVATLVVYEGGRSRTVRVRTAYGPADDGSRAYDANGGYNTGGGDNSAGAGNPGRGASSSSAGSIGPAGDQPTLDGAVAAMASLQSQLRELSRTAATDALADTLAGVEQALGDLRRQLVAAGERERRRSLARDNGRDDQRGGDAGGAVSLPGLRLTPVGEALAGYFGDGSDQGLLVLQADSTWDPIRTGDVILRVNDEPVDETGLRRVMTSRRENTVDLLRRQRELTVVVRPRE